MKNMLITAILTALTMASAISAEAAIFQVVVQCDEAGPAFLGTLDVPNQNQISCDNMGMVETMKVPIVLRFNTFAYTVDQDRVFIDAKCSLKSLNVNSGSAVEQSSSLSEGFEMNPIKGGFFGSLGHCGFKTKLN